MNSNVVSLRGYRAKTRKAFLAKHGTRLDRFLTDFIQTNIEDDFRQMADDYQAGRYTAQQGSWDYVQFREILAEAMDEAFGRVLYQLLLRQPWFDGKLLPRDEIMDRCLAMYIINECQYAICKS